MSSRLSKLNDLRWSDSGDFMLDSKDKDLLDTSKEKLQALIQRIEDRLKSNRGDWKFFPSLGASLTRFAGRANNQATATEIEVAVINELTRGGLISSREIVVQAFPTDTNAIAIYIKIVPIGSLNSMQLLLSYNLHDNKIHVRN